MVEATFKIFQLMGEASRLFVKISRVKVVHILDGPLPNDLLSLDCAWESNQAWSKLLGLFVGTKISPLLIGNALTKSLKSRLKKARKNLLCLVNRVLVANQFVSSALWYMLNLWTGTLK